MRVMPLRVFLREGYQRITEPTVITKHGYPVFSVFPAPGARTSTDISPTSTQDAILRPGPPGPSPNGG